MIYAVQPTTGGPVKIGHSANVPGRIRQLEVHYGQPLALLATLPGGFPEEREVHRRFAHLRLGRTEQFRPAEDLMEFFGRPLLAGANLGPVEVLPSVRPPRGAITVRSCSAWKAAIVEMAESFRMDVPDLIDQALVAFAQAKGFTVLSPRR